MNSQSTTSKATTQSSRMNNFQGLPVIPENYNHLPDHFKLLFERGNPMKRGYSYREWEDYLLHGFSDVDIPALLELLNDMELNDSEDINHFFVQLYAWRILGQLKSAEALEPLLTLTTQSEDNDWISGEVPTAIAMIGKPAMARVSGMLLDETEEEDQKKIAASALAEMAQQHPELREEVIEHFRQHLQSPNSTYYVHNGLLVSHLMDFDAVELIDEIRALFEHNSVDISIPGDLEDVEIELGVRDERSTPRPKYGLAAMEGLNQFLEHAEPGMYDSTGWNATQKSAQTYIRETPKIGRNEPCHCGSGKKYKRCCLNK